MLAIASLTLKLEDKCPINIVLYLHPSETYNQRVPKNSAEHGVCMLRKKSERDAVCQQTPFKFVLKLFTWQSSVLVHKAFCQQHFLV